MTMFDNNQNIFDFLVNNEGEILLLLNQRDGEPKNSYISLNKKENSALLYRNEDDELLLKNIPEDVFIGLSEIDSLLICELENKKQKEVEISQAYEVDIK